MEERIEKHREFLVNRIDPEFGLLDKLLASGILSREEMQKIELIINTTCDKNRILLDFILTKKNANELVSALTDIGQVHLVNFLKNDGGYGLAFGDNWPLSEADMKGLDINRESLIDILDTTDLCIKLFSDKVINYRQKQFILSKQTDYEKNRALLDILTKCSRQQYKQTIACLNDTNQSHIAKILSDGGVLVRLHANLEGVDGNVDEMEDEIISRLTTVLGNRPVDEATRLLELTHQRIIAASKGQSIVFFIHCMTHDELLQLIDLLKTNNLKEILEMVFIEMLSIGDALTVSLTWSSEEFKRASTYFVSGDVSSNRDLQSKLTVTQRPTLSTIVSVEDSRDKDTDYHCCSCACRSEMKSGHVFNSQHFLCENCLEAFCFICKSPPVVNLPRSPFDKMAEKGGKEKANNSSSIVDDCPTKRSIPPEFIYDKVDLELTNISLSGNRSGCSTEATGQAMRMEGTAKSPRKTSTARNISRLIDFAETLREKKEELEVAEMIFTNQGTLVHNQIKKHAKMCRALIDRDEKRLLKQLNEMMNATLSENSAAINSILSLIQKLVIAGERDDEEADEVERLLTTRISTTQFKDVDVHLNDSFYQPEDKNILGELKSQLISDHSSFLPTPVLIGSIADPRHKAVTGVTVLEREIFVCRDVSLDISVYAVLSNAFLRSLSLLNLLEPIVIPSPVDLAAYKTTRSLYVADGGNNYVFHLRPDGKLVHWWSVEKLRGLSVTSTGTVLVGSGRAIREYDYSGRLVRTIQNNPLGKLFQGKERPSMRHPTHFLEKDNGRIVVCDFADARSQHVVYDINRRGSPCACWHGNRADSGDEFLNEPRHLAIDVTGHVMVADRRNNRVKLLDAELKFVRDLIGAEQFFKRPQRLHYDPTRGLLYVGLVAGDTLVFKVTI